MDAKFAVTFFESVLYDNGNKKSELTLMRRATASA